MTWLIRAQSSLHRFLTTFYLAIGFWSAWLGSLRVTADKSHTTTTTKSSENKAEKATNLLRKSGFEHRRKAGRVLWRAGLDRGGHRQKKSPTHAPRWWQWCLWRAREGDTFGGVVRKRASVHSQCKSFVGVIRVFSISVGVEREYTLVVRTTAALF